MDPTTERLMGGAAGAAGGGKVYVEDVFSTDLWSGNYDTTPAPININNGIDLSGSGRGGLVWTKTRYVDANSHQLYDTERGAGKPLYSNITNSEGTNAVFDSFNSNGFSLTAGSWGTDPLNGNSISQGNKYVGWTLGNQKGFFNAVKYTSTEIANVTIPHGLDSVPGMVVIKNTDRSSDWQIWHRSLSSSGIGITFGTGAAIANANIENTAPDSTNFYAKNPGYDANAVTSTLGENYIAYFFAHDDQQFGDDGNESIIKCGIYNDSSAGGEVDLGWEPQWILFKCTAFGNQWNIHDTMRGWPAEGQTQGLSPSTNTTESGVSLLNITSTGFKYPYYGAGDWVYVAIRRGPMKTPEDATKVFSAISDAGSSSPRQITTGNLVDLHISKSYSTSTYSWYWVDRLREGLYLNSAEDWQESSSQVGSTEFCYQDGIYVAAADGWSNHSPYGGPFIRYSFTRSPGFFDIVAYDGDGQPNHQITHNLNAKPELMIVKQRDAARTWAVYVSAKDESDIEVMGAGKFLKLNTDDYAVTQSGVFDTAPTPSIFTVEDNTYVNILGGDYMAYLFASLSGISKVGTYDGIGNTAKDITCEGFTSGARFILIKRIDTSGTGNWGVWDSVRGISSTGDDPFLILDHDSSQANNNDISPLNAGFTVNANNDTGGTGASGNWNINGATYIYLAIA